jgi:glycosyltransferase involved in cell wall biosynthesis
MGGGIERYCDWLVTALEVEGATVRHHVLCPEGRRATITRKLAFLVSYAAILRDNRDNNDLSVLICHPNLAVGALVIMRLLRIHALSVKVIFYGEDIWSLGKVTAAVLRRWHISLLTVSSFSSGALVRIGDAVILSPGLSRQWYHTLRTSQSSPSDGDHCTLTVLSVFRLDAADAKGLPELLDAMEELVQKVPCRLMIAGSGSLPPHLADRIALYAWVSLVSNPSDSALADLYAAADIFVLATRTRSTRPTSGEGFGIALIEAQLAGTPVIAPAHGGSDDAFLEHITGLKPRDESPEALREVLEALASDAVLRERLGSNAHLWAAANFETGRRQRDVVRLLLPGWITSSDCTMGSPSASTTLVMTSLDT